MSTMNTQDKVSKKANPDSEIQDPQHPAPKGAKSGFKATGIYKVVNTFTDSKGRRWQTDDNFPADDEVELKTQLDKGMIRADGEPQEYIGAVPRGQRDANDAKQHQQPAQQNQQPRSNPNR